MLSDADRRLMRHYQYNPQMGMTELAQALGISTATCTRRVEKLCQMGVVRRNEVMIDWRRLGFEVEVSLRITIDKSQPQAQFELITAARTIPEVIEIQTFLGRVDLRLLVIARDMSHYQEIYRDNILQLPHVADIEPLMHVARVKSDEHLPL